MNGAFVSETEASSSGALIPQILVTSKNKLLSEALVYILGLVILAGLAQIAIPLPWTPVPITGQTLGVSLIALSWGRKRGFAIMASYLGLAALGAPVLAAGASGITYGPTLGYLVGMLISSVVLGELADRGFTRTFKYSFAAALIGSAIVFSCGVFVLSFFVPAKLLLISGVLPFLPGDLIKNLIAATASWRARRLA